MRVENIGNNSVLDQLITIDDDNTGPSTSSSALEVGGDRHH